MSWETVQPQAIRSFGDLEAFWGFLKAQGSEESEEGGANCKWFECFDLRKKNHVIDKFFIAEHNRMLKDSILPAKVYPRRIVALKVEVI